jgi:hypothetical protein
VVAGSLQLLADTPVACARSEMNSSDAAGRHLHQLVHVTSQASIDDPSEGEQFSSAVLLLPPPITSDVILEVTVEGLTSTIRQHTPNVATSDRLVVGSAGLGGMMAIGSSRTREAACC